jgi:hypothetical protein
MDRINESFNLRDGQGKGGVAGVLHESGSLPEMLVPRLESG